MYIFIHTHIYIHIYICTYIYTYIRIYVCIYMHSVKTSSLRVTYMYISWVHKNKKTNMRTQTHTSRQICTCVSVYIHKFMRTHTREIHESKTCSSSRCEVVLRGIAAQRRDWKRHDRVTLGDAVVVKSAASSCCSLLQSVWTQKGTKGREKEQYSWWCGTRWCGCCWERRQFLLFWETPIFSQINLLYRVDKLSYIRAHVISLEKVGKRGKEENSVSR